MYVRNRPFISETSLPIVDNTVTKVFFYLLAELAFGSANVSQNAVLSQTATLVLHLVHMCVHPMCIQQISRPSLQDLVLISHLWDSGDS